MAQIPTGGRDELTQICSFNATLRGDEGKMKTKTKTRTSPEARAQFAIFYA